MRRYLSIWFPEWPLDRLRRARRIAPGRTVSTEKPAKQHAFVLYEKLARGLVVATANQPALDAGIHAGLTLTDARATLPNLLAEEIDREMETTA